MEPKSPFGITFIGYFYILGAIVLLLTLLTNSRIGEFGIAERFGVPGVPESLAKMLIAALAFILAYGYLRLEKWGYWLMIIYSIFFLVISLYLSTKFNAQLFYGNALWSVIVLAYTYRKRRYFLLK